MRDEASGTTPPTSAFSWPPRAGEADASSTAADVAPEPHAASGFVEIKPIKRPDAPRSLDSQPGDDIDDPEHVVDDRRAVCALVSETAASPNTHAVLDHDADTDPSPPTIPLAFERAFLGLRSAPWSVRAREAGFQPDEPDAYCPRCAGSVGPGEVHAADGVTACADCREQRLPWEHAVRLGVFAGELRAAILESKYTRWRRLAFDLGRALGDRLAERLMARGIDPLDAAIAPVPMSRRRRWSRGLDHTLAVTRGVRAATGSPLVFPLARRHRPVQASLPRSAREDNARGSFRARGSRRLDTHPVVVVLDDVRTTGATLRAACRAILSRERQLGGVPGSPRIWVATIAVATSGSRREGAEGPPEGSRDLRDAGESLML